MGRCDRRRGPPTADDEEKSAGPERGHRGIRSAAASARARVSIIVIAFELIIRRRRRRYRRYPSRVAPVGAVSSISRWSRPWPTPFFGCRRWWCRWSRWEPGKKKIIILHLIFLSSAYAAAKGETKFECFFFLCWCNDPKFNFFFISLGWSWG